MQSAEKKLSSLKQLALAGLLLAGLSILLFPAIQSHFTMYIEKLDEIPDIKQTDRRLALPEQGKDFCAPVVVANSFVYLARHGYPEILLKEDQDSALPIASIHKLAELMKTRSGPGTTTEDFLEGLKSYIKDCTPYKIKTLSYAGWNRHKSEFHESDLPTLPRIKQGIQGKRCQWLNLGWYEKDAGGARYERKDGHWVTLSGYGLGFDGVSAPDILIVRDPNPVQGEGARSIFLEVEALPSGTLSGPHEGLPRSAESYLQIKSMGNGSDTSEGKFGIIDGAVFLELEQGFFSFGK